MEAMEVHRNQPAYVPRPGGSTSNPSLANHATHPPSFNPASIPLLTVDPRTNRPIQPSQYYQPREQNSSSQSQYYQPRHQPHPLAPSAQLNRPNMTQPSQAERPFGSSVPSRPSKSASASTSHSSGYNGLIKPATPGAFNKVMPRPAQTFSRPAQPAFQSHTSRDDWPVWLQNGAPNPNLGRPIAPGGLAPPPPPQDDGEDAEFFDLRKVQITAADLEERDADAEKHMRRLLSDAIGDDDAEDIEEGDREIEGFADNVRLMPHQVRGVRFMRKRESGRNYGGILADDMGLGKTVQALANVLKGPATAAEKKKGHKATLIVAPLAVMNQWATEARTKTRPGQLKVTTHHSASRARSGKELEKYDVVITTFSTLSSEHGAFQKSGGGAATQSDSDDSDSRGKTKRKGKAKQPHQALFEVNWLRVIIDEAQNIKNRNTKASKAAVALRSKYRWCLTGTPIQNSVEELYSLFLFLRLRPLASWEVFKVQIISPMKEGRTKIAMKRLHLLLKSVMLRRTKDTKIDGKAILNLPGRIVEVVKCPFSTEERAFYSALEAKLGKKLDQALDSKNSYTSVLTLLLRLRQACSHPSLVTKSLDVDFDAVESKPADDQDEADDLADMLGGLGVAKGQTCQICFTKLEVTEEKHCSDCAEEVKKQAAADADLPTRSSKIQMMVKLLQDIENRSERKEKTIVFSQFTSFLDLLEPFLKHEKIKYVRYDGSMKTDKRQESLDKINNAPDVRVILISFKAGSTGLNLVSCNNVILMDLWWNPALEDQAFDRAHRLGQKRDVNIFKLTVEDTVEDRILALQENKRELAKAALSGEGATGVMKLTMDDLLRLFRPSARHPHDDEDDDGDNEDDD